MTDHNNQPEQNKSNDAESFNAFLSDMSGMAKELTHNIRASFGKALEQGMKGIRQTPAPLLDVYQTDDEVVVLTSPLVGLIPSSLEVSMVGTILTIKGETRLELDIPEEAYLRRERQFGVFVREIDIEQRVNAAEAKAKLRDNILTISLPKATGNNAQIIDVREAD